VRNSELNINDNNKELLPVRRTISFSRKIGGVGGEGGGARGEEEEEKEGGMEGRYNDYILGEVFKKHAERRRVEAASAPSFLSSKTLQNRGSSFSDGPSSSRIGRDNDGDDSLLSRREDTPLL